MKKLIELKPESKQDAYATVRTDTHDVLGFVNKSYKLIQNIDAFTFFDDLVAENEAIYETAGVLGKGECIWILAKLPGFINVHVTISSINISCSQIIMTAAHMFG